MSSSTIERYRYSKEVGALCLDFTNSISSHLSGSAEEHLQSYGDLLEWSRQTGALSEREVSTLSKRAAARPEEGEETLARALRLRGAIYSLFSAVAAGKDVPRESLEVLNQVLGQAMSYALLKNEGGRTVWGWGGRGDEPDRMLWPVARSAAEMLVAGEPARVRECAGETCNWLFIDSSKNRSRRWCDMSDCGNRAKARRHYHRSRKMNEK